MPCDCFFPMHLALPNDSSTVCFFEVVEIPLTITWLTGKLASLSLFHIGIHTLEDLAAYTLLIVRVRLSGNWRVMNWAMPSIRIPLALTKGAIVLSTRMEVLALNLCEHPISMPWFQNAAPLRNSISFVELAQSISPRCYSSKSRI
jgi:hypothetical protein